MMKQRSNIVVALDIGSSKIACIMAKLAPDQEIEILGHNSNASMGIKSGVITDLQAATVAILNAIEGLEQRTNYSVAQIYVNIASNNLLSHQLTAEVDVAGHAISSKDMSKLLLNIMDRYRSQDVVVIHSFIYDYVLNGSRGITNPLGMYGDSLVCDVNLLIAPTNVLTNLAACLEKCQLSVKGHVSSAYAAGVACLSADELRSGVTLIELGAGCSSVSVFANKQLVFTDGIPIGGHSITNDIAKGLTVTFEQAERIKTLYGTVITGDTKDMIDVMPEGDGEEQHSISRATLSEIIRARAEEILELLRHKLANAGFSSAGQKVVITGGGANLNGVKDLVAELFETRVRIGYAKEPLKVEGDVAKDLGMVTVLGILAHVAKSAGDGKIVQGNETSLFKKAWEWIKENFV